MGDKRTQFMWVHEAMAYLTAEGIADQFIAAPDRDIVGFLSSEDPYLLAAVTITESSGGVTVDYSED